MNVTALVTGAAGFVGSHLCEALLDAGDRVVGVDCFTGYYSRSHKEENLAPLRERPGFSFIEADLAEVAMAPLLRTVDDVYHLAGQPGIRVSWGPRFDDYLRHNVTATQRLLDGCRRHPLRKLVYSSSSSVYGEAESVPTSEAAPTRPISSSTASRSRSTETAVRPATSPSSGMPSGRCATSPGLHGAVSPTSAVVRRSR
jgi:nucleoside-diphosphate-sugar epimerase